MNPGGIIIALAGVFGICGAVCNWDLFFNSRKAKGIVGVFGRTGARVFYGLLGLAMSVLGVLVILDVVDISQLSRRRSRAASTSSGGTSLASSAAPNVPATPTLGPAVREYFESTPSVEKLGDFVRFAKSQTKLRQPAGFDLAENFEGFAQIETRTSVMVATLPAPFAEATAGLNDMAAINARGWKLLGTTSRTRNGASEMIMHFEQTASGTVFSKWLRAFSHQGQTIMVTAAFPKDHEAQLTDILHATVLSAQVDEQKSNDPSKTD